MDFGLGGRHAIVDGGGLGVGKSILAGLTAAVLLWATPVAAAGVAEPVSALGPQRVLVVAVRFPGTTPTVLRKPGVTETLGVCRWAPADLQGLLGIEARRDQTRNSIHLHRLHVGPFPRWLGLPWFREHVVDPSRSLGFSHLNKFVMK